MKTNLLNRNRIMMVGEFTKVRTDLPTSKLFYCFSQNNCRTAAS